MITRGRHLLAAPALDDPNFDLSVVFMLEHTDEGALGVVINRPSELPVAETFDLWVEAAGSPPVVFWGGPVSVSSIIAVGVADPSLPNEAWNPISGRIGTLDLGHGPDAIPGLVGARMFGGYASWGAGQLDSELHDDAWFVVDAEDSDLLSPDPTGLWWEIVGRQSGPLAQLRRYPREPWLN